MKKLHNLAVEFATLLLIMFAAMFYTPVATAANVTGPPAYHVPDVGKMLPLDTAHVVKPCAAAYKPLNQFSTRQMLMAAKPSPDVGFVIKPVAESYNGNHDYKDDPHIH